VEAIGFFEFIKAWASKSFYFCKLALPDNRKYGNMQDRDNDKNLPGNSNRLFLSGWTFRIYVKAW
jgi:hypothetical protein